MADHHRSHDTRRDTYHSTSNIRPHYKLHTRPDGSLVKVFSSAEVLVDLYSFSHLETPEVLLTTQFAKNNIT